MNKETNPLELAAKLTELVATLGAIEQEPTITAIVPCEILDEDGAYRESDLHSLVRKAIELAYVCLIADGKPHYRAEDFLASRGFKVKDGERDSFGPLTKVITTTKGGILYG